MGEPEWLPRARPNRNGRTIGPPDGIRFGLSGPAQERRVCSHIRHRREVTSPAKVPRLHKVSPGERSRGPQRRFRLTWQAAPAGPVVGFPARSRHETRSRPGSRPRVQNRSGGSGGPFHAGPRRSERTHLPDQGPWGSSPQPAGAEFLGVARVMQPHMGVRRRHSGRISAGPVRTGWGTPATEPPDPSSTLRPGVNG